MEPGPDSAASSPERATRSRTASGGSEAGSADDASTPDSLLAAAGRASTHDTLIAAVDSTFPSDEGRAPFLVAPFGRSWEHWILLCAGLGGLAVMLVLGLFVDPDPRGFGTHERLGLPPCKPMLWWNVPCPGCGVTTSMSLAAHGRFWASLWNQPFGFLVALALPTFAVWCVWQTLRGRDLNNAVHRVRVGRWVFVVSGVMLAAWLYKIALTRHWIG